MATCSGQLFDISCPVDVSDLALSSWKHGQQRLAKLARRCLRHHQDRLVRSAAIVSCDIEDNLAGAMSLSGSLTWMPSCSASPQSAVRDGITLFSRNEGRYRMGIAGRGKCAGDLPSSLNASPSRVPRCVIGPVITLPAPRANQKAGTR